MPDAHRVVRDRLVRTLSASPFGLVEAGAGYGKSVLARQYARELGNAVAFVPIDARDDDAEILAGSLRRALAAAKLSDLVSAMKVDDPIGGIDRLLDALVDTSSPLLVVLDDAHHISCPEATALLLRFARGLPATHRLLITVRRLPPGLEPLRSLAGASCLDTDDLQFTKTETADLLSSYLGRHPSDRELNLLLEATGGWPTALVLAATSYAIGDEPLSGNAALSNGGDPIASVLRLICGPLDINEVQGLIQLAHLPLVSPEVADLVSGESGILERFVAAGIPLARTASGWWEMPAPVSAYFRSQAPIAPAVAGRVATFYERNGEVLTGLRLLLTAGLPDEAARMLAAVSPDKIDDIGWADARDVVEELPENTIRTNLRVLLHLARVAETAHRADLRSAALERAVRVLEDADEPDRVLWREIDAERARDLVWDERTRLEAKEVATSVINTAAEDETCARARALDVLGRLASWFSADGPRPEAESLLEESSRLSGRVGQNTWKAQALVALAMGFYFALCRYERALSTLDEVLAQLPARSRYRALVQSFRGDLLIELGRYAEAEASIHEMREIGNTCREEWALAYAGWTEAALASYTGDRARTVRAVTDADSHRDVWYDQASGVEFLACASDCLDRAGEHDMAIQYLERARARMDGCEHPVRVFEAAVLARSGDPTTAGEAIEALLAGESLEPQERWPLLVLRAHVAHRKGDPDAGRLAREAFDTCLLLGHPEGPLIREHNIARALLPVAAKAGSQSAASLAEASGRASLTMLGGFEVRRGGRLVDLPPGRPSKAVRVVAAAGGRMHSEELLEILWPDVDLDAGRNRLRNLLSRLRVAAGDLLLRDQEIVMLAPGTDSDASMFESQARSALAARTAGDSNRAAGLARSALTCYLGDLLPDDRLESWAAGPRERLRNRFVEILDLLTEDAEERGEADEAMRLLRRAIDAEPYDEPRYVGLGRLLVSQGRTGSARAVVRSARDALGELGLSPSPSLTALELELGNDVRS